MPLALTLAFVLSLTACADTPAAEGRGPRADGPTRRPFALTEPTLAAVYARADSLPRLRSLLVFHRDSLRRERYFHGATAAQAANVKSASKSVISALVGAALARGHLRDVRQTLGELLPAETRGLDTAVTNITVEDLLTMRAGLRSTSFGRYGEFVSSRHWVRHALTRPVEAPRGEAGPMIYSTGSTHLLSAVLARATGRSTWAFGREALAPLGFRLRGWATDPQGVHFGGNEMRLTPRELLAFGRLYLDGGRAPDPSAGSGQVPRVLSQGWIDSSWAPRTVSNWSGNAYGYGWWSREAHGYRIHFAWGYGGQFVFVVPTARLVVVATSDPAPERREGAHLMAVHALVDALLQASSE